MVLAAEFPAMPSSAVKIASERRCAILVHSGSKESFQKSLSSRVWESEVIQDTKEYLNQRGT